MLPPLHNLRIGVHNATSSQSEPTQDVTDWCGTICFTPLTSQNGSRVMFIDEVHVFEEYRNQKVAKSMLHHFANNPEVWTKQVGPPTQSAVPEETPNMVFLFVNKENTIATQLYTHFQTVGPEDNRPLKKNTPMTADEGSNFLCITKKEMHDNYNTDDANLTCEIYRYIDLWRIRKENPQKFQRMLRDLYPLDTGEKEHKKTNPRKDVFYMIAYKAGSISTLLSVGNTNPSTQPRDAIDSGSTQRLSIDAPLKPSLETTANAYLHQLSNDIFRAILNFVEGDPCEANFLSICKSDQKLAEVCRDDALWHALCIREGWDRKHRIRGFHKMDETREMKWKHQFFKWCKLRFRTKDELAQAVKLLLEETEGSGDHRLYYCWWYDDYYYDDNYCKFNDNYEAKDYIYYKDKDTSDSSVIQSWASDSSVIQPWAPHGPIWTWDVSKVKDMSGLFKGAKKFDAYLSQWDVSNVTNMSEMFMGAHNFNNGSVHKVTPMDAYDLIWDTSKVKTMDSMFCEAKKFKRWLRRYPDKMDPWDVSSVTTMKKMFFMATSFDGDVTTWDVSNVTDMSGMFCYAVNFNNAFIEWYSDKRNSDPDFALWWDVSNVKNMDMMFAHASSFNQDLLSPDGETGWNVANLESADSMFSNSGLEWHNRIPDWYTKFMMAAIEDSSH